MWRRMRSKRTVGRLLPDVRYDEIVRAGGPLGARIHEAGAGKRDYFRGCGGLAFP